MNKCKSIVFHMKPFVPATGGQKYEDYLFKCMEHIGGSSVDFCYHEKYATGFRKIVAPIGNLKLIPVTKNYDVLFFNSSKFLYWILLVVYIRFFQPKKEVIIIHHHFLYLEFKGIKKTVYKIVESLFLRLSTTILIPSPYIKELIKKQFPHKKIAYLEIAFDKTDTDSDLSPKKGNLIYVGTIEERKGLKYLIESLIKIKAQGYNYSLTIIGKVVEKDYYNHLLYMIETYALDVSFTGYIDKEQKDRYMSSADIFVFPSLLEGYGMALMEAMSFNLPVIAFDNSAIPFTVKDRYNGRLVPDKNVEELADAIMEVVENRVLRKVMSEGACETFTNSKDENSLKHDIEMFCYTLKSERLNK